MIVVTGIVTGVIMFLVHIGIDWWRNRHNKANETSDLLNKLIDSFQSFVADFMSKDSLKDKNPSDYFVKKSPIKLSEHGQKLADDSGITSFIQKHIAEYAIELNKYKNGLDILRCCRRIALKQLGKPDKDNNKMKEYFYDNGLSSLLMQEVFALALKQEYSKNQKST